MSEVNRIAVNAKIKVVKMAEETASGALSSAKDLLICMTGFKHPQLLFRTCYTNHAHVHIHTDKL